MRVPASAPPPGPVAHTVMGMESFDVAVVGAGLAGLHTARRLAELGHDVLVVERRTRLTEGIRTTGIFVRRTLEDFALPPECLGPPIRRVVLYPPGLRRPVTLVSRREEYRVGEMGQLYCDSAARATEAGVQVRLGIRFGGRNAGGDVALAGPDGPRTVRARFLVGADGARSAVARDLGLDRNRKLLIGAEEVFGLSEGTGRPAFHCVIDPRIAPGYLAWVVNDGRNAHVGLAGYPGRFPHGVRRALADFAKRAPGLPPGARPVGRAAAVERRGGLIPVGGVLRRIANPAGLLVGDAAGAVSPLTAGGLDPCLRLSELAASVLDDALRTGRSAALAQYDGSALRDSFRGRLLMRQALSSIRTPLAASAAFALLRTPLGRATGSRVLFGDGSFPDTAQLQPARA